MQQKFLKLFIAASAFILPSAAANAAIMSATTVSGQNISIQIGDGMQAGYMANQSSKEIYLCVYEGTLSYDENGNIIPGDSPETGFGTLFFSMPVSDLNHIEFQGMTGVESILAEAGYTVNITDGIILISNVESPVSVGIYSLSGIAEAELTVSQDSSIDINRYGPGMHLVKINGNSFKILAK